MPSHRPAARRTYRRTLTPVLVVLTVLACSANDPTGPTDGNAGPRPRQWTAPPPWEPLHGCARLLIHRTSATVLSVAPDTSLSCGLVVPVVDTAIAFDTLTGRLDIAIVIDNRSDWNITGPISLVAWNDSVTQLAPSPPPDFGSRWIDPDSVGSDSALVWHFDTLGSMVGGTSVLRFDSASGARTLTFIMPPGTTDVAVVLHAHGAPFSNRVPPVSPTSHPAAIDAEINDPALQAINDSRMPLQFVRPFVSLMFDDAASLAERQAAIDSIRGEVVGGVRIGPEGEYTVRIRGDSSAAALWAAVDKLLSLPQVRRAGPILTGFVPSYLRPNDGTSWQQTDWLLQPGAASGGPRWHLERIAAPRAWGCETGDSGTSLGVVDLSFRSISDLDPNVDPSTMASAFGTTNTGRHGSKVSGVIGAVGNNGVGMTGVMWRTQLGLYPVTGDLRVIIAGIKQAGLDGRRIVNVSLEYPWRSNHGVPASADSGIARQAIDSLARDLYSTWGSNNAHPLVVIAAGNQNVPAWFSILPLLRTYDSTRVLVVGATRSSDGLWTAPSGVHGSNYGPLVDVAAPGVDVYTFDASGGITPDSGTSLSAPQVTGVAGLVASAHPTFAADRIRQIVVLGARNAGRKAANIGVGDSIPVLNAYEALRVAADSEATGALCGTRIWSEGGTIKAQRGASVVSLAPSATGVSMVIELHGGKRLLYDWNQVLTLQGGAWVSDTAIPSDTMPGGFSNSTFALTHDWDSTGWLDGNGFYGIDIYKERLLPTPGSAVKIGALPALSGSSQTICSSERNSFVDTVITGRYCADTLYAWADFGDFQYHAEGTIGISPYGDTAYVAYPWLSITSIWTGTWTDCPWGQSGLPIGWQCRQVTRTRTVDSTTIYAVPFDGGPHSARLSVPGRVWRLGLSETGDGEIVVYRGDLQETLGFVGRQPYFRTSNEWATNCSTIYYNAGGTPIRTVPDTACATQGGVISPTHHAAVARKR